MSTAPSLAELETAHFACEESLAVKYRPMERLLRETDPEYLASAAIFSAKEIRTFRAERRRLFRTYLRGVTRDFTKITNALDQVMLHSKSVRPDLAKALTRHRLTFSVALAAIHCRLALHAVGMSTVSLDIRGLVATLDDMRVHLETLAFQPVAA